MITLTKPTRAVRDRRDGAQLEPSGDGRPRVVVPTRDTPSAA